MRLPFDIDKDIPIPVDYQLKEQLELLIRNYTFPVGSQLPPEVMISEHLGIRRGTVRQFTSCKAWRISKTAVQLNTRACGFAATAAGFRLK